MGYAAKVLFEEEALYGFFSATVYEVALLVVEGNLGLALACAALLKVNEAAGPIIPTKENPVDPASQRLLARIILLENQLNQALPAGKMQDELHRLATVGAG